MTLNACSKPTDMKFLLKPTQDGVGAVKAFKNNDPKLNNHVQAVADGFNLFGWIVSVISYSLILSLMLRKQWRKILEIFHFMGIKYFS